MRVLYFLSIFVLFNSCNVKKEYTEEFKLLRPGEARIAVHIDKESFYPEESIFKGEISIFDTFFRLNVFDQFESNVVISFGGQNWYKEKPIRKQVFIDNQVAASVLIGKLEKDDHTRGIGYLMTEGEITVDALSEERMIMHLKGKAGRYEVQKEPDKWNDLDVTILYKKPVMKLQAANKEDIFY